MKYCFLGDTGIKVSRICFGTLTIGPLQKNFSYQEGVNLLSRAVEKGINFFDTAETYQTYPYLKQLIKKYDKDLIIASKSYAYSFTGMQKSLDKARKELDRDYLDVFLMHEQTDLTISGHRDAWECLLEAKQKGIIKAVGISTHYIKAVKKAILLDGLDVIHPLINFKGLGIVDGSADEMLKALIKARKKRIGIYSMKPLGGGNYMKEFIDALDYLKGISEIDSIAIGMQNEFELDANCMIINNESVPESLKKKLFENEKKLTIASWCSGCAKCIERCSQGALSLDEHKKAQVNMKRCILCGYCAYVCEDFCIKVF